jgi:hypothetical protein
MGQIDIVVEMEGGTLGSALPLPRETFKHTFFRCEGGVIFAKTSVNNSAGAVFLFELFEKSFLPLRSDKKD